MLAQVSGTLSRTFVYTDVTPACEFLSATYTFVMGMNNHEA
jgi:hypothetical protein